MTAEGLPPDVLDNETLQQLLDLDDGTINLVREMSALFNEDTPPRITLLEEAIRRNDLDQIGDLAHAIKGAASTMGAPRVRHYAQQLELAGRHGKASEPESQLLEKMKAAFEESKVALDAFIASRR